jgi:HD domain-containing protein
VEVASAATDQQLALEGSGGRLMSEFWRLVSSAHSPREALLALPALLRTELGVAEVGVYLQAGDGTAGTLDRIACAGAVDRPAAAFAATALRLGEEAWSRLEAGPLWRASLPHLLAAIDARDGAVHDAPAGSYAAIALGRPGRPVGLIVLHSEAERFPLDRLQQAWALASQAAAVLVVSAEGEGAPDALAELAEAVDARERASQHRQTQDVVALACEVAQVLGLSAGEIERVRHGALLHDIGKASIPSDVLLKPGPLEPAELELVRQHPIIGERILRRVPELADVAPVVRHEHERWDGAGYPDGLAGVEIPIGSRIVLACDAFHAMTTQRPYRAPLPEVAALGELRRHAGTQFDPEVVDALVRVRAEAATAPSAAAA